MRDYPIRVKVVDRLVIVLAYACLPLFGVVYLAGYWADISGSRAHRRMAMFAMIGFPSLSLVPFKHFRFTAREVWAAFTIDPIVD